MALLWYRDPADGALKPYAVPGEELSFSTYVKTAQVVETSSTWVKVAAPDSDPEGDDPAAFGVGSWTAPNSGVWQIELHTSVVEDQAVAVRITDDSGAAYIEASPSSATGQSGCGVVLTADIEAGKTVEFWLNHGKGQSLAMSTKITATRHRRYTPTPGAFADGGSEYVLKAGDTMSGPLILSGDPVLSAGAATKSYADGKVVDAVWGTDPTVAPSQLAVNDAMLETRALEVGAGGGLTGGGAIGGDPVLAVGEGWGVTVGADAVSADQVDLDGRYSLKGGSNASGTWPISVQGNAGSVDGQSFTWSDSGTMLTYVWGASNNGSSSLIATSRFAAAGHGHGGTNGKGIFYGTATNVTLAAGEATSFGITHGWGFSPAAMWCNPIKDDGNHSIVANVASWNSTSCTVTVRNVGTAAETFDLTVFGI